MSSSTSRSGERFCGLIGCTESASAIIRHPKHGERVVCDGCAGNHEVISYNV